MNVFIIEEYDFWKQYWLLMTIHSLTPSSYLKHSYVTHYAKLCGIKARCNCNEWIIPSGRCHSIKLHFPSLESLFEISLNLLVSISFSTLLSSLHSIKRYMHMRIFFSSNLKIFIIIEIPRFLCIWFQNFINFG